MIMVRKSRLHASIACLACYVALLGCSSRSTIDVEAVNQLVSDKHKYKLEFEAREITSGIKHRVRYSVAVPKGWKVDGGRIEPTDSKANGRSLMTIESSCDQCLIGLSTGGDTRGLVCDQNACTTQDWGAFVESRIAQDRAIPRMYRHEVVRDDLINGRRILVELAEHTEPDAAPKRSATVRVFWWNKGAPEFHTCYAWLDEHLVDSASAFGKACELAISK